MSDLATKCPTKLSKGGGTSIRPGRVTKWSQRLDTFRRYLTDSPTPTKFAATLRAVDTGDVAALLELNEEMLAKDAHLQAVSNTRQQALTALPWEVVPCPQAEDQGAATEAAAYVSERLLALASWEDTLNHLATATGPNVAVTELIWEDAELADTVDVPGHRLMGDMFNGPGLFIEIDETTEDVLITPGKFVKFHPRANAGFPFRMTRTHATVVPYLMIHFSRTDWLSFSEIYGMPWRWATFADGSMPDSRNEVLEMLQNMGTDAAAGFDEGVTINTLQAQGTGETYQNQLAWAEKKLSILWLGQTLTTDSGTHGSYAAARVHENVRADLLLGDLRGEARMVRGQVFRPMVELKFPTRDMPLPLWRRKVHEPRDVESERVNLEQLRLAQELGLPITTKEAYEKLDLVRPKSVTMEVIPQKAVVQPQGGPDNAGQRPDVT